MALKSLGILLLICHLLGCATVQQRGVTPNHSTLNKAIAQDTVNRLVPLYPPARTRFYIRQPIKDPYGLVLIELLRQRGYSIHESSNPVTPSAGSNSLTLYYIVDELIKGSLYRATIIVGTNTLSRAYKIKNSSMIPLGFWVRKE